MKLQKSRKKWLSLILIGFIFICGGLFYLLRQDLRDAYARWQKGPIPPAITRNEFLQKTQPLSAIKPTEKLPSPQRPSSPPRSINLSILFIPQAPFNNWDVVHEDTCEEASIMMVNAFLNGRKTMTRQDMEKEMLSIVAYENKTFGYFESTSALETVKMIKEFFGLSRVRVIPLNSLNDIKDQIAKGNPVILPTAGKLLHNPNFKNGGPLYHMIVAKGYTATHIITNDPGTRLGADYIYTNETLWNAIHDWNNGDVLLGAKVMIVVE